MTAQRKRQLLRVLKVALEFIIALIAGTTGGHAATLF